MKINIVIFALIVGWIMTACDAVNRVNYTVINDSKYAVELFIPNFPINQNLMNTRDTVILIPADSVLLVGTSIPAIDFPWNTKKIYDKQPGKCGMKIIEIEEEKEIPCDHSNWKYRKRSSAFKISQLNLK